MKKCNGCEITVDNRFQAGDICPGCHKKWDGEYVIRPSSGKSNFLSKYFFWIVVASFFFLGTMYSLIKDERYEKIAAGYAAQWRQLEADSLNRVADDILEYNVEIRRKLFYMTTKHYLKILNKSDVETMTGLIAFAPVIDSVYHSRWVVYNLGRPVYSYGLYLKIVEMANDDKMPPELRQTAVKAAQKIGKPKSKYYL